jgi:pullulanase/glycogen debranching enzyme
MNPTELPFGDFRLCDGRPGKCSSFHMAEPAHRIVRAWLESPVTGVIELDRDWRGSRSPQFTFGDQCPAPSGLAMDSGLMAAVAYRYFVKPTGEFVFALTPEHGTEIDPSRDAIYVAGDFNGWQAAVGREEWRLQARSLDGEDVLLWTGAAENLLNPPGQRFKFVTGEHHWLGLPDDAPNAFGDGAGNFNRVIDPQRTGRHLWRFTLSQPLDLAETNTVAWANRPGIDAVPITPRSFFFDLKSDLPLGAIVRGEETVFRLFAPRARSVTLFFCADLAERPQAQQQALVRRPDADGKAGVWEIALGRNLHGWFYWYQVDGVREGAGRFDPMMPVLDPYALAVLHHDGPGIVLDRAWIGAGDRSFKTPAWHDLVMVEAHVRDLVAHAPVKATAEERRGFTGLRKWVESPEFYLHHLGVNCVELQPVQEFDDLTVEEYHWGYMTNNWFAPESSYALTPALASGVRELQDLVRAFHRRGMAVVLDVVYNHVGVPAHLLFIDRLYYFEQDAVGDLANWSGCGNDVRARSAMAKRLIIDSCIHLIEAYGIDGFRFDLAELIGADVLREIETALKRVKSDVILIAEPWSFRGHIAGVLRDTGWASWNDGYRDFIRDYVRGGGTAGRLEYFLRGSPWYFAKWPAQTVNYTESHDDRCWIDVITENPGNNGSSPTANDRRRTHLMAAVLFMSLGVPMLAAGQDFLRSKQGVTNTYLRGDLNALDYRRLFRHLSTHTYFADWIAFRRSERGRLLRHYTRPGEGFFQFIHSEASPALAVVYNADRSIGSARLLFAINATLGDATLALGAGLSGTGAWRQLADHERFYAETSHAALTPVEADLTLPALGCGLWVSDE